MNNSTLTNKILNGKTEYYKIKQSFIRKSNIIVFSLNMPGVPKRNKHIDNFQKATLNIIIRKLSRCPFYCLSNEAGQFYFFHNNNDILTAKKICIEIESSYPAFRLLDIDCFDLQGNPVSRTALNYPERTCLLCTNPASSCILNNAHNKIHLRLKAMELIDNFIYSKND